MLITLDNVAKYYRLSLFIYVFSTFLRLLK